MDFFQQWTEFWNSFWKLISASFISLCNFIVKFWIDHVWNFSSLSKADKINHLIAFTIISFIIYWFLFLIMKIIKWILIIIMITAICFLLYFCFQTN